MADMKVSPKEIALLKLNADTLQLAVDLVKVNGYVLLEEVIPRDFIDGLHESFMKMLNDYIDEHQEEVFDKAIHFFQGTNNVRLFIPFEKPYIDSLIIEHPFAMDIITAILGEDSRLTYFASNTSMPGGTKYQQVHADTVSLFGDLCTVPLPIYSLVVNIPLVDTTEENGPMEMYPGGTHMLPDRAYSPTGYNKERLAEHMNKVKATMPAGSILIRDIRMWHRATPNRSNQPRPNIGMIYEYGKGSTGSGYIQIPQKTYNELSDRAKVLLRFEKIGYPVSKPSH
jgi:ectoine hydroxylase-related dioxygenase (phytanoyl-CoA dioxygenase family)